MLAHLSDLKAFCLCVLITLTACAPRSESSADQDSIPVSKAADITADAEAWADSVCASLSLRQKVAQLFIPALFASDDFSWAGDTRNGVFFIYSENFAKYRL